MSKQIKNMNLEYLLFLIEKGNVINYKRISTTSIENKPQESTLKKQYLYKDNEYIIFYFDSFGLKNKNKTKKLQKKEFLIYFERDILNKINYVKDSYLFDYHKQRISRKEFNENITDEFDMKKLVYKWLLKKDSKAVIIPEFGVGNKRADYISFGSKNTYIVEIKSELDTFDRLEEQLAKYQYIGNYIFMALHISKYNKLIKLNLDIPENVGILIVEEKKIKQIKRATKNNFNKNIFKEYASFEECLNIFRGFKWASKFHKDQLIKVFEQKLSIKNQNAYFYEVLRNRHLKESNLRKEFFDKDELKKALGSSSELGISRLQSNSSYTLRQYDDSLLIENVLYDYYIETINTFAEVFKEYENIECITKDDMYPRILLKEFNIKLDFTNEFSYYKSSLEQREEIKSIWDEFLNYCAIHKEKIISKINDSKDVIVLRVGSQKEQENMSQLFIKNNIRFKKESTKNSYFHLKSYLNKNINCKDLDCILLLSTTKTYFHINEEDGVRLYD